VGERDPGVLADRGAWRAQLMRPNPRHLLGDL